MFESYTNVLGQKDKTITSTDHDFVIIVVSRINFDNIFITEPAVPVCTKEQLEQARKDYDTVYKLLATKTILDSKLILSVSLGSQRFRKCLVTTMAGIKTPVNAFLVAIGLEFCPRPNLHVANDFKTNHKS